jgi:hypothetical protein
MNRRQILSSVMVLCLVVVSCTLPSFASNNAPTPDINQAIAQTMTALALTQPLSPTLTFTPIPGVTEPPTATLISSATPCAAAITTSSSVNVRFGPGMVYDPPVGSLPAGATANVDGKSADGTWWYIVFPAGPGGHAWVSGSVVAASCIPTTLAVITAPPTPLPASGTCKDSYVWRLIKPSDKACVPPASKAQADADNAAAASRKLVSIYGPDACIPGYIWRGAYSGDVVCVTSDVQSQAAADNAAAASRWVVGPYGPHTCIAGFVWRTARAGDDVCVTGAVYDQAQADNAAASSRKAGPDTCMSGYIWREAFAGDVVCVTPAVRAQVAADNAAAPSHTWP